MDSLESTDDIKRPPQRGSTADARFVLGMGNVEGNVKILLNINEVLPRDDLVELQQVVERGL